MRSYAHCNIIQNIQQMLGLKSSDHRPWWVERRKAFYQIFKTAFNYQETLVGKNRRPELAHSIWTWKCNHYGNHNTELHVIDFFVSSFYHNPKNWNNPVIKTEKSFFFFLSKKSFWVKICCIRKSLFFIRSFL